MSPARLFAFILGGLLVSGCTTPIDVEPLEQRIDAILAQEAEATVAVAVRVPNRGLVYDRNADRVYHAASTMKIPVMIEVFRQADEGTFSLDDSLLVENRFRSIVDGSEYAIGDDSDDDIYQRLGGRMAIRDLVESMITVSSNLATNLLIDFVGAEAVQQTSESLGTTKMLTLRGVEDLKAFEQGLSNRTTATDLAMLLTALLQGDAVNQSADMAMLDVLARQRFNEMIPAGLPEGTRIAHKTGQITAIHHDAAAVLPETGDPYVLVILIEGLADDTESAALGASVARTVHDFLRTNGVVGE
ncbi:MAG: serine hydrolase [Rhodothermales bacterium]|nr:serine hydrolase [Rhodothermales bacterium]